MKTPHRLIISFMHAHFVLKDVLRKDSAVKHIQSDHIDIIVDLGRYHQLHKNTSNMSSVAVSDVIVNVNLGPVYCTVVVVFPSQL